MLYQICIKEVPDLAAPGQDRMVLNAYDASAVEAALVLREKGGGQVQVVTVGPPSAEATMRRALAMGADAGTHLVCADCGRLDSFAFASLLADHFRRTAFDVILCGKQSQDTDAGLTGPMLAELLRLPYAGNSVAIDRHHASLHVTRQADAGQEVLVLPTPCLVTCSNDMNEPRIPTLRGTLAARSKPIVSVAIETPPSVRCAIEAIERPPGRQRGQIIPSESLEDAVATLFDRLELSQGGNRA
jgi:electron transfer flavoprotein beta subunit